MTNKAKSYASISLAVCMACLFGLTINPVFALLSVAMLLLGTGFYFKDW